jgi:predicted NUDIX family NTP pyrophosphohydrolase
MANGAVVRPARKRGIEVSVPKLSAGLLPYRISGDGVLETFIAHPGGPFWARKDEHAWSVAKGEYEETDDAAAAAEREFEEEIGVPAPAGPRVDLGSVKQPSGKVVRVWAIDAPHFSVDRVVSDTFETEWPPKSGRRQSFPEVDRAEWMPAATARHKLVKGQVAFVDRLVEVLRDTGVNVRDSDDVPRS